MTQRPTETSGQFDEPSVSVIITNYNYGHFLRDCLNSVLGQGRPVDQVIVVDDGSTDGSAAILAGYAPRVEVVRSPNSGQAAAFNQGFARATGDLVLFLDADDLLRAEAIEVVVAHWSADLALLSFGLETIDASGRSTGLHHFALNADDGDNRPRLLRGGSIKGPFAFCPTSGNAFGRAFLELALPMPEMDWRICADAYLVRAAALHGRVRALRRVLAAYRVHGGNNYALPETLEPWSLRRGLRDLKVSAAALEALADCPRLLDADPDTGLVRVAMRLRALEIWASVAAWTGDARDLQQPLRRSVRAAISSGTPLRDRLAAVGVFLQFARAVHRLRHSQLDAPDVPVTNHTDWRGSGLLAFPRLQAKLHQLERPRWIESLPYGRQVNFHERGLPSNLLAEGWSGELRGWQRWSRGPKAALEFKLDPSPGPVEIELCIAAPPELRDTSLSLTVTSPGGRIWSGVLKNSLTIRFFLERDQRVLQEAVRLEICCTSNERRPWKIRRVRPQFILKHLKATVGHVQPLHPHLHKGTRRTMAAFLSADAANEDWSPEADGSATMQREEARLRVSVVSGPEPPILVLVPRHPAPKGWLRVSCGGADLFTGETGSGAPLRLLLPTASAVHHAPHELVFAFTNLDDTVDGFLGFADIGLLEDGAARQPSLDFGAPKHWDPPLNLGQTVFPAGNPNAQFYLPSGWDDPNEEGVRNLGAEATLRFRVPEDAAELALHVALRPVLPLSEGRRHVVGFSARGTLLQAIDLLGEGEVALPLTEACLEQRELHLTLHSVFAPAGQFHAGSGRPGLATFELVAFRLQGEIPNGAAAVQPLPDEGYATPGFLRLLQEAGVATDAHHPASLERLRELRAAIAETVQHSDGRTVDAIAAEPGLLGVIERLGAALAGVPRGDSETAIVNQAQPLQTRSVAPSDRLRVLMLAMLFLPAYRAPLEPDIEHLPPIVFQDPSSVATYLGREPELSEAEDVRAYVRYLERLLARLDTILLRHTPDSLQHRFAVTVLTGLRTTKVLFGSQNLVDLMRLRGRCIERLLIQSGASLALPRASRPGVRRLRIGVLVRSVLARPEGWALLGMYRGLDRNRFEPILITMDDPDGQLETGDRFTRTLYLGDKPLDQAVRAIRQLDLDVFILGAYFTDWEKLSAVVAHRLAPVQVLCAAVSPTTIGFKSFDDVLTCAATEPDDPQAQYAERVAWIQGPLQCCYDFGALGDPPATAAAEIRRAIGVAPDAILMTSGAMAHKVHGDLLGGWAEVLSKTSNTRLVLYPFASNWSLRFARSSFRAHIDQHLAAFGLAPDRVILLEEISPEQVREVLAASDLYLDSFPYTGATTVCEALACGVPVVTLAGENLRGLTGASWVRAYGLPDLVANTRAQYVETAVRLASDPAERRCAVDGVRQALRSRRPPHFDPEAFGTAFSEALRDVARTSGLFPNLDDPPEHDGSPAGGDAVASAAASPSAVTLTQLAQGRDGPSAGPPARAAGSRRVVILGLGRTGSSLLCHLLGKSPNAHFDYELFNKSEIQFSGNVVTDAEPLRERDANPIAWLDRYFDTAEKEGFSLIGFKLFVNHNYKVLHHVVADDRYKLIFLMRKNLLAMYSSLRIAQKTGEWANFVDQKSKRTRIRFDPVDFEDFERDVAKLTGLQMEILAKAGRDVVFLEYESILSDRTIRRLEKFLDIQINHSDELLFKKQNVKRIVDRFTAPKQVQDYLKRRDKLDWAFSG